MHFELGEQTADQRGRAWVVGECAQHGVERSNVAPGALGVGRGGGSKRGFGLLQARHQRGVVGTGDHAGGARQPQARAHLPQRGLQIGQPPFQPTGACHEVERARLNYVSGALMCPRRQCMINGSVQIAVLLPPLAGAQVQRGDAIGGNALAQAFARHVGKEWVIAVPVALIVER